MLVGLALSAVLWVVLGLCIWALHTGVIVVSSPALNALIFLIAFVAVCFYATRAPKY